MLLLGVDAGGTSVRAVACTPEGAVVGRGSSRGGNIRSSSGAPEAHIASAVRAALATAEPAGRAEVAICVGAAGAGRAGREEVGAVVRRALALALAVDPVPGPAETIQGIDAIEGIEARRTPRGGPGDGGARSGAPAESLDGRDGRPLLLTDLDIAFRSAASSPDGTLLVAGTGAVAAAYAQWRQIRRRDGLGWLLGDAGSGTWLGRRVLRAVAAEVDRNGPSTAMTPHALAMLSLASAARASSAVYAAPDPSPDPSPDPAAAPSAGDGPTVDTGAGAGPGATGTVPGGAGGDAPEAERPPHDGGSVGAVVPECPLAAGPLGVDPQDLIAAVDRLAPADWARFAGIALNAAASDAVAAALVDEAAAALLGTLASARADDTGDVILAGGLLASGPLRGRLQAAYPGCRYAPFPVVGACAAAAAAVGIDLDRQALTDALL